MKVAIVHDYLNQYGGAERVLESLHELFPQAPIFTIVYDRKTLPQYDKWDIRPSFIQKMPFAKKRYKNFVLLFPSAVRSFNLNGFDVVISNTHAWAKGIRLNNGTPHICYCLTPMRYIWDLYDDYLRHEYIHPLARYLLPLWAKKMRRWDFSTSRNVQHYIAISETVATRIKHYYKRETAIIYPPCDTDFFKPKDRDDYSGKDYYLTVSRLKAYKRIDVLIEAFNKLQLPLKIIGVGPEFKRLKEKARENIEFLGWISDEKLLRYYQNCKAFVFAGHEDFGLVLAEAQACGKPVIAYAEGGASEIVIDGKTGLLFSEHTAESLISALQKFETMKFDTALIREQMLRFDKKRFKRDIADFVGTKIGLNT